MAPNRRGEKGNFPFRTQRLSCENGQWYFQTREGVLNGPYRDMNEAKKALAVFVAEKIHESAEVRHEAIRDASGVDDDMKHMVEELLGFFHSRGETGMAAAMAWAHNRIAELKQDWSGKATQKERIEILFFAMDQDQHFAHR